MSSWFHSLAPYDVAFHEGKFWFATARTDKQFLYSQISFQMANGTISHCLFAAMELHNLQYLTNQDLSHQIPLKASFSFRPCVLGGAYVWVIVSNHARSKADSKEESERLSEWIRTKLCKQFKSLQTKNITTQIKLKGITGSQDKKCFILKSLEKFRWRSIALVTVLHLTLFLMISAQLLLTLEVG